MNDVPIVEILVQVSIFLYDVDFVDGATIRELARSVGRHPTLFDYYVTKVTFAINTISMLFLKLIVGHRVINLLVQLETWRDI